MSEREESFRTEGATKICCNPPIYVNISREELRAIIREVVKTELKPLMQGERRSLLARADALRREYD